MPVPALLLGVLVGLAHVLIIAELVEELEGSRYGALLRETAMAMKQRLANLTNESRPSGIPRMCAWLLYMTDCETDAKAGYDDVSCPCCLLLPCM